MKTILIAGMLLAAATAARAQEAQETSIKLRCDGVADKVAEHTSYRLSSKGLVSTSTSYANTHLKERLLFELVDGVARVHLPKSLVPQLNTGSDNAWWTVIDLKLTETTIEGRFRINFINRPSFRIDRINGDIDLAGFNTTPFRGQCESNLGAERKF